jgi:2-phosphosulfolactate phosphatase
VFYQQDEYQVRCEWGLAGVEYLAPSCDVVVIVDVLSFSTCIDIAVSRGASVYPYRWKEDAGEFARQVGALVAGARRAHAEYSLSPVSLMKIPAGTGLVLPSPNGSTLSLATGERPTLAGCLRNAAAVASAAQRLGERILVVPAGEQWPDMKMRPAVEDMVGAGAIIRHLAGTKSPEAMAAQAVFLQAESTLRAVLEASSSGKELIERGYAEDVAMAAELNVSSCAPLMVDGAYQA